MPCSVQQCIALASKALTPHSLNPKLEAEILLSFVLLKPRSYLYAWPKYELSQHHMDVFRKYLLRAKKGEPIAYIIGKREFFSLNVFINADTLIPRPETELIVETVLRLFPNEEPMQIADLGTGSGAIALAIAKERTHWQIHATDLCHKALEVAKQNANYHRFKNIRFSCGNWCEALRRKEFAIIVSNPPYISETEWPQYAKNLHYEPKSALVSGSDGLSAIKEIILSAPHYLHKNGYLMLEHGFSQAKQVRTLFESANFRNITTLKDLAGMERISFGRMS